MRLDLFLARAGGVGWVLFVAVLVATVLLRFWLPAERRRRLRPPLVMAFAYLLLAAGRSLATSSRIADAAVLLGGFFLTLALIQLLFVVVFDALPFSRDRVPRIVQDLFLGVVYFVALMALFNASGVELSSILTTSALVTAVIGFALQDTLGNVVGGLAIQVQRPFKVGDWVSFDGQPDNYGVVTEINWRVTRLVTNQRVEILVPNSVIAKNAVTNFSRPSRVVRRGIRVSIAYDVPPSRVEEVALRAMRSVPEVVADPPPECVLESFGDSGIVYWCRFFIEDFRRRDVIVGSVAARLYYEFSRESIPIPYPIRTLYMHQRSDEQARKDQDERLSRLAQRFQCIDFLAPLGPEVLSALARRVNTSLYGRGEAIVREGEAGSDFYLIERGEVSVTVDSAGTAQEIARLKPGDFFGEMSLMTGEARRATILALGDVEAVRLDKDSFREVLTRDPHVLEEISRVLAARMSALDEHRAATAVESGKAIESRSAVLLHAIRDFFRL